MPPLLSLPWPQPPDLVPRLHLRPRSRSHTPSPGHETQTDRGSRSPVNTPRPQTLLPDPSAVPTPDPDPGPGRTQTPVPAQPQTPTPALDFDPDPDPNPDAGSGPKPQTPGGPRGWQGGGASGSPFFKASFGVDRAMDPPRYLDSWKLKACPFYDYSFYLFSAVAHAMLRRLVQFHSPPQCVHCSRAPQDPPLRRYCTRRPLCRAAGLASSSVARLPCLAFRVRCPTSRVPRTAPAPGAARKVSAGLAGTPSPEGPGTPRTARAPCAPRGRFVPQWARGVGDSEARRPRGGPA